MRKILDDGLKYNVPPGTRPIVFHRIGDAAGSMVNIHDRRPIWLSAGDALEWVDPNLAVNQALEILSTARSESAFQWWQVTKKIGNSRYQMPDATRLVSA